jgi:type I restriction enzyme S subunit
MIEWKESALEDCLDRLIDYRGKSPARSSTGIPVISAKVVKTTGLLQPIEQTIDPAYYPKWMTRGLPKIGDVVLTTEGPLGEVIQLDRESATYALGQRVVCLRGKAGVLDNTFLRYLLTSPVQQEILASYATGTTVEGISQKALRSIPISYPDYATQVRIGQILAPLDDKIMLNRRMSETLEAMAQAIFRDWFVDFGPVRRKLTGTVDPVGIMGGLTRDAARAADLAALFGATLTDDGLPKGWRERAIGDQVEIVGGSTPSTADESLWRPAEHRWATPKDLSNMSDLALFETGRRISSAGLAKITSGLLPAGTVLLSSRAPIGYLAIAQTPVAINQGFIALKPTENLGSAYLYLWCKINMEAILANANGSTFQEISKKNFRPITSSVPDDVATLRAFGEIAQPLIDRIVSAARESRTLAETRDYLLPRLMSGALVVAKETA